jgi:hypothetical protein
MGKGMLETGRVFADFAYRNSGAFIYEMNEESILYQARSGETADLSLGFDYLDNNENKLKVVLSIKNILQ